MPFDFSYFPVLETGRMILRPMRDSDAEAVFAIFGDDETCRHFLAQAQRGYASVAEARANVIDWAARQFQHRAGLRWALTQRGDDTLIGTAGYNFWDQPNHRADIGYDLNRALWGRGLMPEAMHAILHFGFGTMMLHRVEADVTSGNAASVRVLEKCGFAHEGTLRERYWCNGRYFDHLQFGLLRSAYEAQFGPLVE